MKKSKKDYHPSPAQLANLRRFDEMSPEEHRELSARGGRASKATQHQKFVFKQAARWLMSEPAFACENDAVNALKERFPDLTNAEAMTAAVMKKAIDEGDAKAYSVIRDTTGEIPTQNVNLTNDEPMTITIKTVE